MAPRDRKHMPGTGGSRSGTGSYAPIVSARTSSGGNRATIAPIATPSALQPSIELGIFCHYCGDYTRSYHQCAECKAIVCQQDTKSSTGCIAFRTVRPNVPFFCPLCARKAAHSSTLLSYVHHGFINRKNAKLCWPMCLMNIKLEMLLDGYASEVMNLEARYRYGGFLDNLFTTVIQMKKGAHVHERKKTQGGCNLIARSIDANVPANVFIVVDTHSEEFSGMLQHSGGQTGGHLATLKDILAEFLGKDFMGAMKSTSEAARRSAPKPDGDSAWYDDTPYTRGGWRGVFLMTCGPAVKAAFHFESLCGLVEESVLDFVVGFGGASTLPATVLHTIQTCIWEVGLHGKSNVWDVFCKMMAENEEILHHTSPVIIYSTTTNGTRVVRARRIARHILPWRAFGFEFKACNTQDCNPPSYRMNVKGKSSKFRVVCTQCGWKSVNLLLKAHEPHFYQVNPITAPLVFWHSYPPSPGLQNLFVDASRMKSLEMGGRGDESDMSVDDE